MKELFKRKLLATDFDAWNNELVGIIGVVIISVVAVMIATQLTLSVAEPRIGSMLILWFGSTIVVMLIGEMALALVDERLPNAR